MSTDSGSETCSEDHRPLASGRRRKSAINYGKIVEDMSFSEFSGFEIYSFEDDDLSLRYAAANSRLPFDRLSAEELNYFADLVMQKSSKNLYLYLRNRCLQIWHMGPQVQLTFEAFKDQIKSPMNSDVGIIARVHGFLERHCYINYGLFHVTVRKTPSIRRKIIVIGAGYAGLMAANQLRFFGFDVVLLEGRPRTGGRVMTYRFDNKLGIKGSGDLGGMIVMGVVGNPIMTIVQQSPIRLVQVNQQSAIYERNGERIPIEKDQHIQQAFDLLLDTCTYISKEMKINSLNGKSLSLGTAIDYICNQMELRVQRRRSTFWKNLHIQAERQKKLLDECYILGKEIKRLTAEIENAIKNKEDYLFEIELHKIETPKELERMLELRCYRRDLKVALEKFKSKTIEIETQRMHYKELLRIEPCQVYMNAHDKTIVNFHKANLEYANGCPLHKISLEYWDADDEWDLDGAHFMIKGGYAKVTTALSDAVKDITKKSHLVTNIEIIDGGVKVKGIHEIDGKPNFEETAAGVICTIPLGVLKWSLEKSEPNDHTRIRFTPPLPKWKTKAIEHMGFGSLNKAVLFFDKPFWGPQEDIFCRLSETTEARGECFQFFAVPKEPVLIALISGTAANLPDGAQSDALLKNRTMLFLRSTFPNCPPEPIEFIVTRWHRDRYARGCYSYISVDASDKDHEVLGEPICDSHGTPRIFFGGEHTICRWPSTVHGAMLSGMREATRVADTFNGPLPVYANENQIISAKHESLNCVKREEDSDVKTEDESDIDIDDMNLSDEELCKSEPIDEKLAEKLLADDDDL